MPAVGMRRSTRVFGLVMKGSDVGRVLRSGRRLLPENSVEVKTNRVNEVDDWVKPLTQPKKTVKNDVVLPKPETRGATTKHGKRARDGDGVDRRFGIVYTRKRRRTGTAVASSLELSRRNGGEGSESGVRCVFAVTLTPCAGRSVLFSSLLVLILSYMRRISVALPELLAFLLSEPIHAAYASRGIRFLQGSPTASIGICRFFGILQFLPSISVDFSAVPFYFEHLHSAMLLNYQLRSCFLVHSPINVNSDDDDVELEIDFPEYRSELQISSDVFKRELCENVVIPDVMDVSDGLSLPSSTKGTGAAGRKGQFRNIVNTRGIQKRRSSLRKTKARSPLTMTLRRSNRTVASDLVASRKSNSQLSGTTSTKKPETLANVSTTRSLKEASSAIVDSTHKIDSSLCFVNILVTEPNKCYREDGAIVTLEMSNSSEWLLNVKKDGVTRCTFKAEKVMRPCYSCRSTHRIIFSLVNGWKLEFANRQDWTVFKDLYKQCSDKNATGPVKCIPVPGVREVSSYAESNSLSFHRPATYIYVHGDEISRAMTRRTANYDMDSEDEEWLSKFNHEFQEHLSEDNFELIIDALEKAYYVNSDDSFDLKSVASRCLDLGSKEIVEAVYTYWMIKRKQKHSLLIRVFQSNQSKRAPLIPKPLLRKRRSFKRHPSQFYRGNQPRVLKAEQDALEENATLKIEEAKASANASMEIAIQKRKRAQSLAKNADLVTYKAAMLIKIAEAAQAVESVEAAAEYYLD